MNKKPMNFRQFLDTFHGDVKRISGEEKFELQLEYEEHKAHCDLEGKDYYTEEILPADYDYEDYEY